MIDLREAKTKLLTACEDKFGKSLVYSPKMDFDFTNTQNFWSIYDILNAYLFANKLPNKRHIKIYACLKNDLIALSKQVNLIGDTSKDRYAIYAPEIDINTSKLKGESIFLLDDYGKKTFLFAVSCICHELIHCFDAHNGILIRIMKEDEKLNIDRSHQTPCFVRYMKLAAMEGIRVMTNGNNTPYDILNQEAIQFAYNLQEDNNENFYKLVERLKAGEKIPNVYLTPRNTVAFFIP